MGEELPWWETDGGAPRGLPSRAPGGGRQPARMVAGGRGAPSRRDVCYQDGGHRHDHFLGGVWYSVLCVRYSVLLLAVRREGDFLLRGDCVRTLALTYNKERAVLSYSEK